MHGVQKKMFSLPMVTRELRIASRRKGTYYSRTWCGAGAVGCIAVMAWMNPAGANKGDALFSLIYLSLLVIFLVAAPLLAADSINRERRDGTLGLLFLTPLRVREILLGKVASRVCRLLYFGLMMVPVMMLPILVGGFDLKGLTFAAVLLLSTLMIGIASGLLASVLFIQAGTTVVWALCISAFAQFILYPGSIYLAFKVGDPYSRRPIPFMEYADFAYEILTEPLRYGPDLSGWLLLIPAGFLFGAVVFFLGVFRFAAWKVKRHGQESFETARQIKFRKRFLTPMLWKGFFRKSMNRRLDKNPFIWLEFRSAWQRSARSVLLLVYLFFEAWFLSNDPGAFLSVQIPLIGILVAFLLLKVCSSFQKERETGAFELILVTPLTEKKLLYGRLRAVFSFYQPLLLVLLGAVATSILLLGRNVEFPADKELSIFCSFAGALVSVPLTGLFFALKFRTIFAGLAWTAAVSVAVPVMGLMALPLVLQFMAQRFDSSAALLLLDTIDYRPWTLQAAILIYHLLIAAAGWRGSLRALERRSFMVH